MSTRSQFGFYETDNINIWKTKPHTMLYKHWDGYPSGNLPLIFSFLSKYFKGKNNPSEINSMDYFSAWFLYYIINNDIKRKKHMNKSYSFKFNNNGMDFLGFGIDKRLHGDIEYYYAFTPEYLIVYDISVYGKTNSILFKAPISTLVMASRLKDTKIYPYNLYEPYLSTFMDTNDLSEIQLFMEEPKKRNTMIIFDLRDETTDNRTLNIGYQIINVLNMPHEDLPTMISSKSPLINALVKCRLEHNI